MQNPVSGIDSSGLVDVNTIGWKYGIKGHRDDFFAPLLSFTQNTLISMHGLFYNSNSTFTILGHGYKGWSTADKQYESLAEKAKNTGKAYIELDICELGQGKYEQNDGNIYGIDLAQKLHDLSGLPVKYTEDYVQLPSFGFGQPTLHPSSTARTHGWQWIK